MKELYPHQIKAVDSVFEYFEEKYGNPLVVAPVAAGKSLIIAEIIRKACELYPTTNFIVLSHVTELLTQDSEHLYEQWPLARTSFYADKLKQKSFDGQIIFASINSIYKKAYNIPHAIDIVIIDEAHLISPDDATMYRKFLDDLKTINPYVKIVGLTGTNFRATEGRLTEGDGRLFTDVCYQIPMLYLIEKGFLCPLVTPEVHTKMDTTGVSMSKGDFIEKQLQKAVDVDRITKACVDEIVMHGKNRKKWIIFTAGVEHCEHVMEEIRSRGIKCDMVVSKKTTDGQRKKIVEGFKYGDLQCLVNVGCFTTGFNNPAIDLMAFMRPTRSPVLYVQMGGRGMRTSPGKEDCCLLDFGGVIKELGPIDLIDAYRVKKGSGDGEAPVKVCPDCNSVCFAGARACHECGHEFNKGIIDLSQKPSYLAPLSSQIAPLWHDVQSVTYKLHQKDEKKPSLCVCYNTYDGPYREWICYEHTGFPRMKAVKWHKERTESPVCGKVGEAFKVTFKRPTRIQTKQSGKYHEIINYSFDPIPEEPTTEPSWEPQHSYFRRIEGLEARPENDAKALHDIREEQRQLEEEFPEIPF